MRVHPTASMIKQHYHSDEDFTFTGNKYFLFRKITVQPEETIRSLCNSQAENIKVYLEFRLFDSNKIEFAALTPAG